MLEESLTAILDRAWQLPYVQEFTGGLTACRATCRFFDFCRGAQAGNRYFENRSFASTETNFCRVSRQELVQALANTTKGGSANPLEELLESGHQAVADLIDSGINTMQARWDNRPTWDNWNKKK